MATTTALMTVAQFRELEDPPGAYYELRHGEVVAVTRPKYRHWEIQETLRDQLKARAGTLGVCGVELAFRPLPEYELWAADVAYFRRERRPADRIDDNFRGAPDLVIEVLSPSNTVEEMEERRAVCLENGALEFWIVSPKARTITVHASTTVAVYKAGDSVPVDRFFPGQPAIAVNDIFADIQ